MNITLTSSDGHAFQAWITGPENAERGVVVLPEIFGITAHIRDMAERFAAQGYRAICPSLFDRQAEKGIELGYDDAGKREGLAIRAKISDEEACLDIEAAARALDGQSEHMLTGYCWGGYLTWRAACMSDAFDAASCWYGGGIVHHCHDEPRAPVQLHFGGRDPSIPMKDVETIRKAQPDLPIYVYPEAGHAFGRDGTPAHHAESAQLAWERTLAFFAEHSGKKQR